MADHTNVGQNQSTPGSSNEQPGGRPSQGQPIEVPEGTPNPPTPVTPLEKGGGKNSSKKSGKSKRPHFDYDVFSSSQVALNELTESAISELLSKTQHNKACPTQGYVCNCGVSASLARKLIMMIIVQQKNMVTYLQSQSGEVAKDDRDRIVRSSIGFSKIYQNLLTEKFEVKDLNAMLQAITSEKGWVALFNEKWRRWSFPPSCLLSNRFNDLLDMIRNRRQDYVPVQGVPRFRNITYGVPSQDVVVRELESLKVVSKKPQGWKGKQPKGATYQPKKADVQSQGAVPQSRAASPALGTIEQFQQAFGASVPTTAPGSYATAAQEQKPAKWYRTNPDFHTTWLSFGVDLSVTSDEEILHLASHKKVFTFPSCLVCHNIKQESLGFNLAWSKQNLDLQGRPQPKPSILGLIWAGLFGMSNIPTSSAQPLNDSLISVSESFSFFLFLLICLLLCFFVNKCNFSGLKSVFYFFVNKCFFSVLKSVLKFLNNFVKYSVLYILCFLIMISVAHSSIVENHCSIEEFNSYTFQCGTGSVYVGGFGRPCHFQFLIRNNFSCPTEDLSEPCQWLNWLVVKPPPSLSSDQTIWWNERIGAVRSQIARSGLSQFTWASYDLCSLSFSLNNETWHKDAEEPLQPTDYSIFAVIFFGLLSFSLHIFIIISLRRFDRRMWNIVPLVLLMALSFSSAETTAVTYECDRSLVVHHKTSLNFIFFDNVDWCALPNCKKGDLYPCWALCDVASSLKTCSSTDVDWTGLYNRMSLCTFETSYFWMHFDEGRFISSSCIDKALISFDGVLPQEKGDHYLNLRGLRARSKRAIVDDAKEYASVGYNKTLSLLSKVGILSRWYNDTRAKKLIDWVGTLDFNIIDETLSADGAVCRWYKSANSTISLFLSLLLLWFLFNLRINPFFILLFVFIFYISIPVECCTHSLTSTMVGKRYYDNQHVFNVTSGEATISPRACIVFSSSLNGKQATLKKVTIVSIIKKFETISLYKIVDNFQLSKFCDWKCWGGHYGQNLRSWEKLVDQNQYSARQVFKNDEQTGWHCGGCWQMSWSKRQCAIHWNSDNECTLKQWTFKEIEVKYTVEENGKIEFETVTLNNDEFLGNRKFKIKLRSIVNDHKKILDCNNVDNHLYELNSDFTIPSSVIAYQVGTRPDIDSIKKSLSFGFNCGDICGDSCQTTLRGARYILPNHLLHSIPKIESRLMVPSINVYALIEGVLTELPSCNITKIDVKQHLKVDIRGDGELMLSVEGDSPCDLNIESQNTGICHVEGTHFSINSRSQEIYLKLSCKDSGITEIQVGGQKAVVNVEPRSVWGYIKNKLGYDYDELSSSYDFPSFEGFPSLSLFSLNPINALQKYTPFVLIGFFLYLFNPLYCALYVFICAWWFVKADMGFYTEASISQVDDLGAASICYCLLSLLIVQKFLAQQLVAFLLMLWFQNWITVVWFFHASVSNFAWKTVFYMKRKGLVQFSFFHLYVTLLKTAGNSRLAIAIVILSLFEMGYYKLGMLLVAWLYVLRSYNINCFGRRIIFSFHTLFPKQFATTSDMVLSDPEVLEDLTLSKSRLNHFSVCSQTTEEDFDYLASQNGRVCATHNGKSGTFDSFMNYMNESFARDGKKYCGFQFRHEASTQKNVLYVQRSDEEERVKIGLATIDSPIDDPDDVLTKSAKNSLSNLLSKMRKPYIGCSIEWGYLEKMWSLFGVESGFSSPGTLSSDFPKIFQFMVDSFTGGTGFGFQYEHTVYTGYHVTQGKSIVIPDRCETGEVKKVVLKPKCVNESEDYICYGKPANLPLPEVGEWAFVVNPISQQMLFFRVSGMAKGEQSEYATFDRMVLAMDDKGKVTCVKNPNYGFYGWSGLPIISCLRKIPIGVYGHMHDTGGGTTAEGRIIPTSKHVRCAVNIARSVRVDWEADAKQFCFTPGIHQIVRPTASGKSTMFPLEMAKLLSQRAGRGIILVLNPLKVVPVQLKMYLDSLIAKDLLQHKIKTHYVVGKQESASFYRIQEDAKDHVVILYMSYGKWWVSPPDHGVRIVMLDEIHVKNEAVVATKVFIEHSYLNKDPYWTRIPVIQMTATSEGNVGADRDIVDIEHSVPDDKSNTVRIAEDFYFSDHYLRPGRKHLIFVPTKRETETIKTEFRTKHYKNIYNFYRGHTASETQIQMFNDCDTGVMICTNAAENGITFEGVTDVWDCRTEYTESLSSDGSLSLVKRPVDQKSAIQRRGRAGRTTVEGYYHYPIHMKTLPASHGTGDEVMYKVACMFLSRSENTLSYPDPLKPWCKALKDFTKGCTYSSRMWEIMSNSDCNPMTFLALAYKDSGRLQWTEQFIRIAFSDTIQMKGKTYNDIVKGIDIVVKDKIVPDNGVHWYVLDSVKDTTENNNLGLGLVGAIGTGITLYAVMSELASNQLSYARSTCVWVIPTRNWHDLLWGCQFDFVTDYDYTELVGALLPRNEPKLINDNRLLTKVLGRTANNSMMNHLLTGVINDEVWELKTYTFSTVGKLLVRVFRETTIATPNVEPLQNLKDEFGRTFESDTEGGYFSVEPSELINRRRLIVISHSCDAFLSPLERTRLESLNSKEDLEHFITYSGRFDVSRFLKNSINSYFTRNEIVLVDNGVEPEEVELNNYVIALQSQFVNWFTSMSAAHPELIPVYTFLSTTGTLVVGGVSLCWDLLTKRFGQIGAFGVGALFIAYVTTPQSTVTNLILSLGTYAVKSVIFGNGVSDITGKALKATPIALAASVFSGSVLSGLSKVWIEARKTDPVLQFTKTGLAVNTPNGSVLVNVKSLYAIFRKLRIAWNGGPVDFADLITQLTNWAVNSMNMSLYHTFLSIIATVIVFLLQAFMKTKDACDRLNFAMHTRDRDLHKLFVEHLYAIDSLDDHIMFALSIASVFVNPASAISVGIMAAFGVFMKMVSDEPLTRDSIKDTLKESLFAGAGLPLWLCFSELLMKVLSWWMTRRGAPVNNPIPGVAQVEENSLSMTLTAITVSLSTVCTGLKLYSCRQDDSGAKNSLLNTLAEYGRNTLLKIGGLALKMWDFIKNLFAKALKWFSSEKEILDDGSALLFAPEVAYSDLTTSEKYLAVVVGRDDYNSPRLLSEMQQSLRQTGGPIHYQVLNCFADLTEEDLSHCITFQANPWGFKKIDLNALVDHYESLTKTKMLDFKRQGASGISFKENFCFTTIATTDGLYIFVHLVANNGIKIYTIMHLLGGVFTCYVVNTILPTKMKVDMMLDKIVNGVIPDTQRMIASLVGCVNVTLLPTVNGQKSLLRHTQLIDVLMKAKQLKNGGRPIKRLVKGWVSLGKMLATQAVQQTFGSTSREPAMAGEEFAAYVSQDYTLLQQETALRSCHLPPEDDEYWALLKDKGHSAILKIVAQRLDMESLQLIFEELPHLVGASDQYRYSGEFNFITEAIKLQMANPGKKPTTVEIAPRNYKDIKWVEDDTEIPSYKDYVPQHCPAEASAEEEAKPPPGYLDVFPVKKITEAVSTAAESLPSKGKVDEVVNDTFDRVSSWMNCKKMNWFHKGKGGSHEYNRQSFWGSTSHPSNQPLVGGRSGLQDPSRPKRSAKKYVPYSREPLIHFNRELIESMVDEELIERKLMEMKIPLESFDIGKGDLTLEQYLSPPIVIKKIYETLNQQKHSSDVIYDVCCGTGALGIITAKKTGCSTVGIEVDPLMAKKHAENLKKLEVKGTTVCRDFFSNEKKYLKDEIVICNPPFGSLDHSDIDLMFFNHIMAEGPEYFFFIDNTVKRKKIEKLIPANYHFKVYQFAFPLPRKYEGDKRLLTYIPCDLFTIKKNTSEYNSVRSITTDVYINVIQTLFDETNAEGSLEEIVDILDSKVIKNIKQFQATDFDTCIYHGSSKFDPALKTLDLFTLTNVYERVEDLEPRSLIHSLTNIRNICKKDQRMARNGRLGTTELPNVRNDWYYRMADADKSFNLINKFRIDDTMLEYRNSCKGKEILLIGCDPGLIDYVAIHSENCHLYYDAEIASISSNPTNNMQQFSGLDCLSRFSQPLIFVNIDKFENYEALPQEFYSCVLISENPLQSDLANILDHFNKVQIHISPTTNNGELCLFVNCKRVRAPIHNPYIFNQIIRSLSHTISDMRNNIVRKERRRLLSYPRGVPNTLEWTTTMTKRTLQQNTDNLNRIDEALKPIQLSGGTPAYPCPKRSLKHRLDRLDAICDKYHIKKLPADRCNYFVHQPILCTYKKSDRMTKDSCMVSAVTYDAAHTIFGWDPENSVVIQVSKSRDQFLTSIQERMDREIHIPKPEYVNELRQVMWSIRNPTKEKFRVLSFEETKKLVNAQGAAGMWDEWANMEEYLKDPRAENIFRSIITKLRAGKNVEEDYNTLHNKVESKVSDVPVGDEQKRKPRAINYKSAPLRFAEWAIYGQFLDHHYKKGKLFKHATGGTPIHLIGDKIKTAWEHWAGKGEPTAAMGDASKWDHSLWPALMALECEFVASFFEKEDWDLICNNYEHTIWPIVFTRLGFAFSNPGHRASGHVFTWLNTLLQAILHEWAWKKTLDLPFDANLDDFLTLFADGDDNVHISTSSVITDKNMKRVQYWMKEVNITIRSKTSEGYRITTMPTDIDYLSHYYSPVHVACSPEHKDALPPKQWARSGVYSQHHREMWLPRRPIAEILGKMVYTMKHSTTRDTVKIGEKYRRTQSLTKIEEEALEIESSKISSYMLLYPHIGCVRALSLPILANIGFAKEIKQTGSYWQKSFLDTVNSALAKDKSLPNTIQGALQSLYGSEVKTLDDISLVDHEWEIVSAMEHFNRVKEAEKYFSTKPRAELKKCASDFHKCQLYICTKNLARKSVNWGLYQARRTGQNDVPFPEYFFLWKPTADYYNRVWFSVRKQILHYEKTWLLPQQEKSLDDYVADLMGRFTTGIGGKVQDVLSYLKSYVLPPDKYAKSHSHTSKELGPIRHITVKERKSLPREKRWMDKIRERSSKEEFNSSQNHSSARSIFGYFGTTILVGLVFLAPLVLTDLRKKFFKKLRPSARRHSNERPPGCSHWNEQEQLDSCFSTEKERFQAWLYESSVEYDSLTTYGRFSTKLRYYFDCLRNYKDIIEIRRLEQAAQLAREKRQVKSLKSQIQTLIAESATPALKAEIGKEVKERFMASWVPNIPGLHSMIGSFVLDKLANL
nr:MAG: RNA-dependent RNA polymerase [brine shrimp flavi-like virus 1]